MATDDIKFCAFNSKSSESVYATEYLEKKFVRIASTMLVQRFVDQSIIIERVCSLILL